MKLGGNSAGFTLMEVMIAITLFAFFITAYMSMQGSNVRDSENMQEELVMQRLCEQKINELMIDPPVYTDSLASAKTVKNFEGDFSAYKFEVEYKPLTIPDFSQVLMDPDDPSMRGQNTNMQKMIFQKIQENVERIIWQVRVTVFREDTNASFALSTWVINEDAPMDLNMAF